MAINCMRWSQVQLLHSRVVNPKLYWKTLLIINLAKLTVHYVWCRQVCIWYTSLCTLYSLQQIVFTYKLQVRSTLDSLQQIFDTDKSLNNHWVITLAMLIISFSTNQRAIILFTRELFHCSHVQEVHVETLFAFISLLIIDCDIVIWLGEIVHVVTNNWNSVQCIRTAVFWDMPHFLLFQELRFNTHQYVQVQFECKWATHVTCMQCTKCIHVGLYSTACVWHQAYLHTWRLYTCIHLAGDSMVAVNESLLQYVKVGDLFQCHIVLELGHTLR